MRRYAMRLPNILSFSRQKTPNPELQNPWILSLLSLKILESCPIVITVYGGSCYHKGGNHYNEGGNYYYGCGNHYPDPKKNRDI